MESKAINKTKARLIVLAIFLIGFLAGGFSMSLYRTVTGSPDGDHGKMRGGPPQAHILDKMEKKLSLTAEQREKVKAILDETFTQYDQVRRDIDPRIHVIRQQSRERIRVLLTDEQKPKYEELVAEADAKREKMKEHFGK